MQQRRERHKYGELAFQLTDEQRGDAVKALEILGGGCTLVEAARTGPVQPSRLTSAMRDGSESLTAAFLCLWFWNSHTTG